jgi:hypothetical protein
MFGLFKFTQIKFTTETIDVIEQNSKMLDLRDDWGALIDSSHIHIINVILKLYRISRLKSLCLRRVIVV